MASRGLPSSIDCSANKRPLSRCFGCLPTGSAGLRKSCLSLDYHRTRTHEVEASNHWSIARRGVNMVSLILVHFKFLACYSRSSPSPLQENLWWPLEEEPHTFLKPPGIVTEKRCASVVSSITGLPCVRLNLCKM
jgi:hypothetical protein